MQVCSEADLHKIILAGESPCSVVILVIEKCPEY